MPERIALRSSKVVTPTGVRAAIVVIEHGLITEVLPFDARIADTPIEDLAGVLLPGLVDSHVHVNEPGRTDWEGWATASRAAALGGVTTIVDMPLNSSPVTTTREALDDKRAAADASSIVDAQFWGGLVPSSTEQQLTSLAEGGVHGFKCFLAPSGIDEFPAVDRNDLERLMPIVARTGLPLLAHAELVADPPIAWDGPDTSHEAWAATRPASFEHDAVALLVELAERTGCRVHVVHVSSAESVELIRGSELVTWETCPHYLTLCSADIADGDTSAKCAPPIRTRDEVDALWREVLADSPAIVSDHSPAPPSTKAIDTGSLRDAWGGISSLGLQLPLLATELHARGVTGDALLERLAEQLAAAPARIAGLDDRAVIAPGMRADLALVDIDEQWTIRGADAGWRWPRTVYEGRVVRGRALRVWVGGRALDATLQP
jgi:allantoinase